MQINVRNAVVKHYERLCRSLRHALRQCIRLVLKISVRIRSVKSVAAEHRSRHRFSRRLCALRSLLQDIRRIAHAVEQKRCSLFLLRRRELLARKRIPYAVRALIRRKLRILLSPDLVRLILKRILIKGALFLLRQELCDLFLCRCLGKCTYSVYPVALLRVAVAPVHFPRTVGHVVAPLALVFAPVTENNAAAREASCGVIALQQVAAGKRFLAVALVLVVRPLSVVVSLVAEHKLALAVAHTVLEVASVVFAGVVLVVGELALAVRDSVSGFTDVTALRKQYFKVVGYVLVLRVHLETALDAQSVAACPVFLADHTIHISSTHLSPRTVPFFARVANGAEPCKPKAPFRGLLYITKFCEKFLPFRGNFSKMW